MNFNKLRLFISKIYSIGVKRIINCFFLFSIYVLSVKLLSNSFDLEYAVGIFSVISFITFMLIGYSIKTKDLLLVVCFSVLTHGVFVIGQVIGYDWAWDFVSTLMRSKDLITKSTTELVNERFYDNAFSAYGRVKGTNVHIHVFSSIIGSLSMFLFFALTKKLVVFKRSLYIIMFLVSLLGLASIFLTFTRSIILASIIVFLIYFLRLRNFFKSITTITIAILISVISYNYFFKSIEFKSIERIVNFDGSSNADKVRLMTYKSSLNAINDAPFFGGGKYNYDVPPHNVFLNIAVKFGLCGLIIYLISIWTMIRFYWSRRGLNINKKHKLLLYLLAIVIFINLFNSLFHTNGYLLNSIYQLLFTGIIIGQILREEHVFKYLLKQKK